MEESSQPFVEDLNFAEAVRKRPGMYVGSVQLFGFINYLVCPVSVLLAQGPTRLDVTVKNDAFRIEADIALPIEETAGGRLSPFEEMTRYGEGHGYEGTVLNSLSETFQVEVHHQDRVETVTYRRGIRESREVAIGASEPLKTILTFVPDSSIFQVATVSPAVFKSYLYRLSFLHQGLRFSFISGSERVEFCAKRGILDLFDSIIAPYQILHEPIHIHGQTGSLRVELVFAYHSWTEDVVWSFINNGRAVEGGTHEQGLKDAMKLIARKFKIPSSFVTKGHNGVIAVMSVRYPDATWEGCIKAKISNPELQELVRDLIVSAFNKWLTDNPDLVSQLRTMQTFQIPDVWYL